LCDDNEGGRENRTLFVYAIWTVCATEESVWVNNLLWVNEDSFSLAMNNLRQHYKIECKVSGRDEIVTKWIKGMKNLFI
jgi:hypothetical protein